MSERIASTVKYLGLENDGVVVAGGVLEAAGVRQTSDIDICVNEERFRQLRESGQWTERHCADGRPMLRLGGDDRHMAVEVATDWGDGYSYDALKKGDFVKKDVHYAGLDAVYAWKQDHGRQKDAPDIDLIKRRLFERPMPEEMTAREVEFLKSVAPESLHGHPALRVAANGLLLVGTLYGKDYRGPVRRYTGDIERDVPAFGHTRFHTAGGIVRLRQQIDASDAHRKRLGLPSLYSESDRAALFALYSYHDAIIGARGVEERKSAELVRKHLIIAGSDFDAIPDKSKSGVESTAFDDIVGAQTHKEGEYKHIRQTTQGVDLGNLPSPFSPIESVWMGIEDLCKIKSSYDRVLAKRAEEIGVTIHDLETALAIADSSPETIAAYANKMRKGAALHANYTYSDLWELDNPQVRHEHAVCLRSTAQRVEDGTLKPSDTLRVIKDHVLRVEDELRSGSKGRVLAMAVPVDLKLGRGRPASATGPKLNPEIISRPAPEVTASSLRGIASELLDIQEQYIGSAARGALACISSLEDSVSAIQEAAGVYDTNRSIGECLSLLDEAATRLRQIVNMLDDDDGLKGLLEAYINDLGFE